MLKPISSPYCEAILRLVKVDQVLNSKSFMEWDGDEYEDAIKAYNNAVEAVNMWLEDIIEKKILEQNQQDTINGQ